MKKMWPQVEIREVLKLDLNPIRVTSGEAYNMVGVYSFGRGLFLRETLDGANTSYRVFYRLKRDHVIMSQLFGWEGALALSSEEYEGKYVSPQFPTFLCNPERLNRAYFGWMIRRRSFWDELGTRTRGMGDRRRTLNPEALLSMSMPLPPVAEQCRIVACVEEFSTKIEEANALRDRAIEDAVRFVTSLHLQLSGERIVRLAQILVLDENREQIRYGQEYPQVGVRGFGQGLFARETLDATQTTYRGFNRLYEGALVLSQVKGWEGAVAVCGSELAGRYVSPEYRTFRCVSTEVIPSYLASLVSTPWFWMQLKDITRGVGARRERTRPEHFLSLTIPMPSLEQQKKAIPIFEKIITVGKLQMASITELNALMPSILSRAFAGEL